MNGTGTVRAGVIGAGVFGRFHAQKYAALDGVQLIGIADSHGERAMDASAVHGVGAFTRIDDLLAEVDIVSVATPAVTHAAVASRCLAAGKHVYLEKPIATTEQDADMLIALAQRQGLVLQVGHQERIVVGAAGLLSRAAVPVRIECVRAGPFNGRATDVSVALDLMIHDLDLLHLLVRSPATSVKAAERPGPGGLSDEVEADIVHANGCRARLLSSRNATARQRTLTVVYPDGEIVIDFLAKTVKNTTPDNLPEIFRNGAAVMPEAADPVGSSVARFVAAVRSGGQPYVAPLDARRALEAANLVLAAARARRPAEAAV